MLDNSRYPSFNDAPHARPVLAVNGKTLWGEWVWLVMPVIVVGLALIVR